MKETTYGILKFKLLRFDNLRFVQYFHRDISCKGYGLL